MKLSKCERRVLRMTGRSSPCELTERSPQVILKRVVSRLLIRHCPKVRHLRCSSMLVTLDVLLYRRKHHRAARRCILSILIWTVILNAWAGVPNTWAVLNQGWGGGTKPLWALAFKVDEFTRTLPHVISIRDSIRLGTFRPRPVAGRTPNKFSDSYRDFCNPHGFKRVCGYYPTRPKILWEQALFCIVKPRSPSVAELIVLGQWDT